MDEALPLLDRLRAYIGQPGSAPVKARDPVNQPAIRRWCDAMGDVNPLYQGDGGVSPPAMLEVWTMAPFSSTGERPRMAVLDALDAAGFTGVVATNLDQEYPRYLRPGDLLTMENQVESVSEEKHTGLGVGHFVSLAYVFYDQQGETVGRMRFRLLKFRPPATKAQAPPPAAAKPRYPRPNVNQDTAFFWQGVADDKLLYRRCAACHRIHHPPGPMCPQCNATEWRTEESSGRGVIHSFVVMHHPAVPPFEYPNPIGLIELAEGFRLVGQLKNFRASPAIGDAVQAMFFQADDELRMFAFQPESFP